MPGPPPWTWPSPSFVNYFWDSVLDSFHLSILGFTAALLGLVSVTTASGGLQGMINVILRLARGTPRAYRWRPWAWGFSIFFDDYANTAIVGPTVRPLFDRLKLSRAKLAYLIDSTAAPIAGLALVSTWIGTEVSYLPGRGPGPGIGRQRIRALPLGDGLPVLLHLRPVSGVRGGGHRPRLRGPC